MFGAIGLYQDAWFFALIDEGRLYFLTDAESRRSYLQRGAKPFVYGQEKTLRTYYEVPVDILEDEGALCEWAREAVAVQKAKPARKRKK